MTVRFSGMPIGDFHCLMPSTSVLKGVVTVPDDPNIDFEVDRNTLPLPLLQELTPPIHMIELLSGACGGWKVATQSKSRNTGIEFRTLAMDLDLDAALAYAIGFGVPLVSGKTWIDPALASVHKNLAVHADIAGDTWLGLASAWKPGLITISAPCQPWSSAGSASGLFLSWACPFSAPLLYASCFALA